jgi:hypothetical protein
MGKNLTDFPVSNPFSVSPVTFNGDSFHRSGVGVGFEVRDLTGGVFY